MPPIAAVIISVVALFAYNLFRLESAGVIERIADSQDKRSSQVALTEKGKVLIEQAVKTHTDVQNEVLAVLEPEQRQNLAGLLKKILLNLSDEKGAVSS